MRRKTAVVLCAILAYFPAATARQIGADDPWTRASRDANSSAMTRASVDENVNLLLEIFRAVEQRDDRRFTELVDPEFQIHWPPSVRLHHKGTWSDTWTPLQPTESERRMDPRVVAASNDEVVVLWHQRGVTPAGERFDGEVLGLYKLRAGKLVRAQMFYFDAAAVSDFLARAAVQTRDRKS
jgi:ketosteroid isomerase-like protein